MAMDPRTHPRGAPPDFSMTGLPANPNPQRITDALWWLVQMRLRLEPRSQNGGVLAIKPGYHSYGSRLTDHGEGDSRTDHSIRRAPDRRGPWWEDFSSAHDWTFDRAHTGNYTEINLYCNRLRDAMRDPDDPRPDNTYAYFIGQIDNDRTVEGYNEYRDDEETGDASHLWHRHDSFRRDIIGDFGAMWRALTIDMGWTVAEWRRSLEQEDDVMPNKAEFIEWLGDDDVREALARAVLNTDGVVEAPKDASPNPDGSPNTHWAGGSYLKTIYAATVSGRGYAAEARTAGNALVTQTAALLAYAKAEAGEVPASAQQIAEAVVSALADDDVEDMASALLALLGPDRAAALAAAIDARS